MVKRGGRDVITVEIYKEIYENLKRGADSLNFEIKKYINELLAMNIEKDAFLKKYAPFLEKVGLRDNVLLLKDNKLHEYVEIFLKNEKLYCAEDESANCIHIHFALALPELGRITSKNK